MSKDTRPEAEQNLSGISDTSQVAGENLPVSSPGVTRRDFLRIAGIAVGLGGVLTNKFFSPPSRVEAQGQVDVLSSVLGETRESLEDTIKRNIGVIPATNTFALNPQGQPDTQYTLVEADPDKNNTGGFLFKSTRTPAGFSELKPCPRLPIGTVNGMVVFSPNAPLVYGDKRYPPDRRGTMVYPDSKGNYVELPLYQPDQFVGTIPAGSIIDIKPYRSRYGIVLLEDVANQEPGIHLLDTNLTNGFISNPNVMPVPLNLSFTSVAISPIGSDENKVRLYAYHDGRTKFGLYRMEVDLKTRQLIGGAQLLSDQELSLTIQQVFTDPANPGKELLLCENIALSTYTVVDPANPNALVWHKTFGETIPQLKGLSGTDCIRVAANGDFIASGQWFRSENENGSNMGYVVVTRITAGKNPDTDPSAVKVLYKSPIKSNFQSPGKSLELENINGQETIVISTDKLGRVFISPDGSIAYANNDLRRETAPQLSIPSTYKSEQID